MKFVDEKQENILENDTDDIIKSLGAKKEFKTYQELTGDRTYDSSNKGGQMNFEEKGERGLVRNHLKNHKKIHSGLNGAQFDRSYIGVRFVNEDDDDFNNDLAEDIHIDKMANSFISDTPEHNEAYVATF